MITSIELTNSGIEKLNNFFLLHARNGVHIEDIVIEVCDRLMVRVGAGESLVYELGRQYTKSGRPELLHLVQADIEVIDQPH